MKTGKAPLSELFKNGENFQFNKIDYSTEEATKNSERLRKEKEEPLKSLYFPLHEMEEIRFNPFNNY
jgi:hypothetical protein